MLDYSRRLRRRSKYFTLNLPGMPRFGRNLIGVWGCRILQNHYCQPAGEIRLFRINCFNYRHVWAVHLVWPRFADSGKVDCRAGHPVQWNLRPQRHTALLRLPNQNRMYVNLADIPKYVREGTVSVEDRNFYSNQGFSITGYLRAALNIVLLREFPAARR